jgi:hypothetical protein
VELYDSNPDRISVIPCDAYKVDEQWVLETMAGAYSPGYILIVTYSITPTMDGLDDASGTMIPAGEGSILMIGAAGFTALSRSSSRAETINMQPAISAQVASMAQGFLSQFRAGLASQAGAWFAGPPALSNIAY